MDPFIVSVVVLASFFLVWSCIEVGSNDATNLVNAVLGANILRRHSAVLIAGFFVVLGASFASPVMDTVRKGIFDISFLNTKMILSVFITVYLVGTILLYCYSLYGLPVSTTATLVFALAGAAVGVSANLSVVNWPKLFQILSAILVSILITGFASFILQRLFRRFLSKNLDRKDLVFKHGSWVAGFILTSLLWFMVVKGLKNVEVINNIKREIFSHYGTLTFLTSVFLSFTLFTYLLLNLFKNAVPKYLFHFTAILGMACMAFAFGQNDLANCASPGVTILMIWFNGVGDTFKVTVPIAALSACGFLMFLGMLTKRANRVTKAGIKTASEHENVDLYSPKWCTHLAQFFLKYKSKKNKENSFISQEKDIENKAHYDSLRASIILAVGGCVIAFASSYGLPVSTTYVAFAAVIGSGWGDNIYSKGQADLKLGRTIWVITGWFMGAFLAMFFCVLLGSLIYNFGLMGLYTSLFLNIFIRYFFKQKSDLHEKKYSYAHLSEELKKTDIDSLEKDLLSLPQK